MSKVRMLGTDSVDRFWAILEDLNIAVFGDWKV